MISTRRLRWLLPCGALLVAYAICSATLPRESFALDAIGDLTPLALVLVATVLAIRNAIRERGRSRSFWIFIAVGCSLWALNFAMWARVEILLRRELPDPFVGDIVLFFHVIPFIAAVALRPHRPQPEGNPHLGMLSFLMLLVWWMFLYAFVVFPDEYVVLNKLVYTRHYDRLYLVENLVLLITLAFFTWAAQGPWRKIYATLLAAMGLYTAASTAMNAAILQDNYYTGSWYDLPLIVALLLMIWSFAEVPRWAPKPMEQPINPRWQWVPTRLAMLAVLSAPMMAMWALFADPIPQRRNFRLATAFLTIVVLGFFTYVRQYLLDRQLLLLLTESRASLENLQRVKYELVQKEKIASVGQLAAGVAHEINNPLAAILGYSELLLSQHPGEDYKPTVSKIAAQARRTRDLVSRLLSFAQQAPAEKTLVEIGSLLQRAMHLEALRMEGKLTKVHLHIAPDLPRVRGNAGQLLQCFMHIIANARDVLLEAGGGTFIIDAEQDNNGVRIRFSDSGPGIQQPARVFDPFYTTKPVGKGAGLGLSVAYGIVQDHGGQITCSNRPEGGATFVVRLPAAQTAAAAQGQW